MRSEQPPEVLSKVWRLTARGGDGLMREPEYAMAVVLLGALRSRALTDVPTSLPPVLLASVTQHAQPRSSPGPASAPSPVTASSPAASRVDYSALSNVASASAAPPPSYSSPLLPSASPPLPVPAAATAVAWAVTPAEQAKYYAVFADSDRAGRGLLSGADVRDVLMSTNLPQATLQHVWNLASVSGGTALNPEEFAVALKLVHLALAGQALPQVLPPDWVPPSRRQAFLGYPAAGAGPVAAAAAAAVVAVDADPVVAEARAPLTALRRELEEQRARSGALQAELGGLQQRRMRADGEAASLKRERTELERQVAAQGDELERERAAGAELATAVQRQRDEMSRLRADYEALSEQARTASLAKGAADLKATAMQRELDELRAQYRAYEAPLAQGRAELAALGADKARLGGEIESLRKKVKEETAVETDGPAVDFDAEFEGFDAPPSASDPGPHAVDLLG